MKKWAIWLIVGPSLAIGIFGNACGKQFGIDSPSSSVSSATSQPITQQEVEVYANTKTASLVYGKQVLPHLQNCAGVAVVSDTTASTEAAKVGSISETGSYDSVTAPMLMAVTSIAGEVCNDLINEEMKLAPQERRIFRGIDFASTTVNFGGLGESLNKLARSCWQRDESSEEKSMILDGLSQVFSSEANVNMKAGLSLCTQVLSSIDTLVL